MSEFRVSVDLGCAILLVLSQNINARTECRDSTVDASRLLQTATVGLGAGVVLRICELDER